jgi:hypothetical protein
MTFRLLVCALGAFVAGLSAPALAASDNTVVVKLTGKSFIKTKKGTKIAAVGDAPPAGSQIVVGKEAMAELQVGSCHVSLAPATFYVVPGRAPCAAGEAIRVGDFKIQNFNGSVHALNAPAESAALFQTGPEIAIVTAAGLLTIGIVGANTLFEEDPVSKH